MKIASLLSLIFPRRCPFCGRVVASRERVCESCAKKLPSFCVVGKTCPRCAREIEYCGCDKQSFCFDGCVSPFYYDDIVRRGILNFKFKSRQSSASAFASFAADAVRLRYSGEHFDFVCAVPLTRREHRRRGFNQSEIFARALAKELSIPYREILVKPKDVEAQRTLPADKRRENVAGAFAARSKLYGETILLADDVITTGATLDSCAKALKDAGAGKVYCVVIACTRPRQ